METTERKKKTEGERSKEKTGCGPAQTHGEREKTGRGPKGKK
jgi:hypothetical protein